MSYTRRTKDQLAARVAQDIPEGALRGRVLEALWLVGRLLEQTPKSKNKIYALHEPEVDVQAEASAVVDDRDVGPASRRERAAG